VTDHHGLPTPRSTLRDSSARVLVWCKACRHQADADLQKLVDEGRATCRRSFYAVVAPDAVAI
jgi:hypothetical protein